jgi:hypothetical protein
MSNDSIPGFTDEQAWALRTVAKQAAQETVAALESKPCGFDCQDMADVKTTLFGASEKGIVGLDERTRAVERSLGYAAKALWIALAAFIVAGVGLFVK